MALSTRRRSAVSDEMIVYRGGNIEQHPDWKCPRSGAEHHRQKKFGSRQELRAHASPFTPWGFHNRSISMNGKILLLASVFLGGSVLAAAAQSGTGSGMGSGSGSISAATHCLDKATGQPKLKSAAAGSGSGAGSMGSSGTSGSSANTGSGSRSGSAGAGSGSTTGSGGMAGSAANLPSC
jgi:hypothetical protein